MVNVKNNAISAVELVLKNMQPINIGNNALKDKGILHAYKTKPKITQQMFSILPGCRE